MDLNRSAFFASVFLVACAGFLWANASGPPPNYSGLTPGMTCVECHNALPAPNLGGGSVSISGLPTDGWVPGQQYPLMVSVSHAGQSRFGFQMTAVDSANAQAGTFIEGAGMSAGFANVNGKSIQHIQHAVQPSFSSVFAFDWIAPPSATTGSVRFNVAANAANGDNSSFGDFIYAAEQVVAPAQVQEPPSLTEVFYFPQIADGGPITTTIFVTNPAVGTTANIQIDFTASDGTPMAVAFRDSSNQLFSGSLSFQLAAGQSRKFVSTAAGATVTGFAKVSSDVPVKGTAVFSLFSGSPATAALLGEAGVGAATPATVQAIFVDESEPFGVPGPETFRTALAYANPTASVANITFDLQNAGGQTILTTQSSLAPNNHGPLFVDELFPTIPPGHVGTLRLTSDVGIVVVSLRFFGGLFTSVPPFGVQ